MIWTQVFLKKCVPECSISVSHVLLSTFDYSFFHLSSLCVKHWQTVGAQFMWFKQFIMAEWLLLCVCVSPDDTGGAGELLPDTRGPGVGVPASPQGPGHTSALRCSPWYGHWWWELRWDPLAVTQKLNTSAYTIHYIVHLCSEVLRFTAEIKVRIQNCENTLLQMKFLHSTNLLAYVKVLILQ